MESCIMSKLQVTIWGVTIHAEGALAMGAALVIVIAVLAVYRF
jgi:hypothetical protein